MRLMRLVAIVCAALLAPAAALAQPVAAPPVIAEPVVAPHTLPAGPISRLGPHDLATWRAGWWWHGWRGGRVGWWWCAGGYWYWYAAPIYPFPSEVPGSFVGGGYPALPRVWWFCDNPAGYYPYVRGCWRWRPVTPGAGPAYPPMR